MILDAMLERFAKANPVGVMGQAVLERVLNAAWVDEIFDAHAKRQYTRELLFSTVIELMGVVAVGRQPSLHAALQSVENLPVSIKAIYDKINRTEPAVVRALVRGVAEQLRPVLDQWSAHRPPIFDGYRLRVIDGNHLPASDKRLGPLRGVRGAALPGHSLVVFDPDLELVLDLVPCEDAHAQERTLIAPLIDTAGPGELWIADRHFSTRPIMSALAQKGSAFVIRESKATPHPTPITEPQPIGRIATGMLAEQSVTIPREGQQPLVLRRIELELDEPTEDGETHIRLLTNLPPSIDARRIAEVYRRRWSIENLFQRLESALQSEIPSLGHPRAALLAFGVSVLAYDALSVVQTAIEVEHGLDRPATTSDVSMYYLANEIQSTATGLRIAVDDAAWEPFRRADPATFAAVLLQLAAYAKPHRYRTHRRAPKPKTKKEYVSANEAKRHVSTYRTLKNKNNQ